MIAAGASGLSANLTTSSFTRDAMLQDFITVIPAAKDSEAKRK